MSTFILVHGAWHGAWCWQKIIPLLEQKGHRVIAQDLPGHGKNKASVDDVNLKAYVKSIADTIAKIDEPIILVGHSMGGIIISQLAELFPKKIKKLIYLSGFLPKNGEFLLYLAEKLPDGLVNANLVFSRDKKTASVKKEMIAESFYNDCNESDIEKALALFSQQAMAPMMNSVRLSAEKFSTVKKAYIHCEKDNVIPLDAQKIMVEASPCEQVLSLPSGHSPFISMPEKLVEQLHSLT